MNKLTPFEPSEESLQELRKLTAEDFARLVADGQELSRKLQAEGRKMRQFTAEELAMRCRVKTPC